MNLTPGERLLRMVFGRPLEVHLSEGMEDRLRAHIDRYNHEIARSPHFTDDDQMDPNDDGDLAIAFIACADRGLAEGEREHGLVGADWGEIMPTEQVAEIRRRRQEQDGSGGDG